ncbi:unnamed protein product [Mortierella alpina]
MCCNLVHADDPEGEIVAPAHRALAGTVVSSLHRLKDIDNSNGGFFVFGDMSVRMEGRFRLRFTLFELLEGRVFHVMSTISNTLTVHSSKTFPGMSESTFLSRSFADQGVRIRIRKGHHVKPKMAPMMYTSKNGPTTAFQSPPLSCQEEGEYMSDTEPSFRDVSATVKHRKMSPELDATTHRHLSPYRSEQQPRRSDPAERWEWTPPSSPDSTVSCNTSHPTPHHRSYHPHNRLGVDRLSNLFSNPPLSTASSKCHGSCGDSIQSSSFSERSGSLLAPSDRHDPCPPSFCSGKHRSEQPLRHISQHPYRCTDLRNYHYMCSSYDERAPSHDRGRRYTEGSFPSYRPDRIPTYPMGIAQTSSALPTRRSHHRHASMGLISFCDTSSTSRCASHTAQVHRSTSPYTTPLPLQIKLPPTSQLLAPLRDPLVTPGPRELWRAQVTLPSTQSFSIDSLVGMADRPVVMRERSE